MLLLTTQIKQISSFYRNSDNLNLLFVYVTHSYIYVSNRSNSNTIAVAYLINQPVGKTIFDALFLDNKQLFKKPHLDVLTQACSNDSHKIYYHKGCDILAYIYVYICIYKYKLIMGITNNNIVTVS